MQWRVDPPKANGETWVHGLDLGRTPIWWDSSPKYVSFNGEREIGGFIVLKLPGATMWSARWETKYYGTTFQVLKITRIDDDGRFVCEEIIQFPMRQKAA